MSFGGVTVFPIWQKTIERFRKQKLERVKSTESGKLNYLESIRGLAALTVVFAHILTTYFPAASGGPGFAPINNILEKLFYGLPFGFLINGHLAVVIFFTLSGFVLTYKYFQSHDERDLHKQLAKRYFRLAIPIFIIVTISYFMISNGAMSAVKQVAQLTNSLEAGRIFDFTPDFWGALYDATIGVLVNGNSSYNPVLWTMQIELAGSILVFGFTALIGKLRKRWILYLAAIILLNQSYFTCFILGAALADLVLNTSFIDYARKSISPFYIYTALLFVYVLACCLSFSGTILQPLLPQGIDTGFSFRLWHFFGAALLLAIILIRPELQRILNMRLLVLLGGLSFAVYLTHYLILHSLGDFLYVTMRTNHGVNSSALIAALATIVVTIGVSIAWKKYVDDMSVNVSRRFARYFLK